MRKFLHLLLGGALFVAASANACETIKTLQSPQAAALVAKMATVPLSASEQAILEVFKADKTKFDHTQRQLAPACQNFMPGEFAALGTKTIQCLPPNCQNIGVEQLKKSPFIEGKYRYRFSPEDRKLAVATADELTRKWSANISPQSSKP
jgi:hypothetical protein